MPSLVTTILCLLRLDAVLEYAKSKQLSNPSKRLVHHKVEELILRNQIQGGGDVEEKWYQFKGSLSNKLTGEYSSHGTDTIFQAAP